MKTKGKNVHLLLKDKMAETWGPGGKEEVNFQEGEI